MIIDSKCLVIGLSWEFNFDGLFNFSSSLEKPIIKSNKKYLLSGGCFDFYLNSFKSTVTVFQTHECVTDFYKKNPFSIRHLRSKYWRRCRNWNPSKICAIVTFSNRVVIQVMISPFFLYASIERVCFPRVLVLTYHLLGTFKKL